MPNGNYFTADGLKFLGELKSHNEKKWFDANKGRFESGLKEPGMRLIDDFAPVLKGISKHFVAEAKPNGGSMSRIYRDTRFSKDKSPYKTHLFIHFGHRKGNEDAMPGFYFHIEPGDSAAGGGVWHPATPALERIRKAIDKSPDAWQRAKGASLVGSACSMGGESLKKVPRGYEPDHRFAEDLKRKDFGVTGTMNDKALTGTALLDELEKSFRTAAPVIEFLCNAVGLPF